MEVDWNTHHADAVVNVGGDDEDCVGEEQVEFNNSKAHCEHANDNSKQWDEQPVERLTASVAHCTHHTTTLQRNDTVMQRHCNTTTLQYKQWDEQPVERLTASVAHCTHHTTTLQDNETAMQRHCNAMTLQHNHTATQCFLFIDQSISRSNAFQLAHVLKVVPYTK